MAGFITKPVTYVYEGEWVNGAADPVPNGILMVEKNGKLVLPTADTKTKFVCKEVTTIYDGVTAYRFVVDALNGRYYFIENGFDINDSEAYDKRTYTTAVDEELRAHPIQLGEEFVTNMVTGTPAKDSSYSVQADGTIG